MREARERAGMTQAQLTAQLAEHAVSIDPSGVARIERGERSPRLGEAVTISEVLGIRLTDADDQELRTMLTTYADAERQGQVVAELAALEAELRGIEASLAEARAAEQGARAETARVLSRKAQILSRWSELTAEPES